MSLADRSFDTAVDRIEQLTVAYGAFAVEERGGTLPVEVHERVVDRSASGEPIGGVSTWVRNDDGEVLLVRRREEAAWADPAGTRRPDETYTAAASRVVREEAGIECEITGVHHAVVFELAPVEPETGPPVVRLDVVFEGTSRSVSPTPRGTDVEAVRWWRTLPDQLLYPSLTHLPIPDA